MEAASALNIGPIPPKWMAGIPIPMQTAATTISTSLTTLTQATARTPLVKTKPTNTTTQITIAGVLPMASKLATDRMMPTPVICSST